MQQEQGHQDSTTSTTSSDPHSQQRGTQLSLSGSERTSPNSTRRQPRQTNRSRTGCWPCRQSKVKCDEIHPRCARCMRLNHDCDWGPRWNFSDATPSTQVRLPNVNTAGNAVWDSSVRAESSVSPTYSVRDNSEDFDFQALTTDEDREGRAEARQPGTFVVVLTPDSFRRSGIPVYADTSESQQPRQPDHISSSNQIRRPSSDHAPNVVILTHFEDHASSPMPALGGPVKSRHGSLPEVSGLAIDAETTSQRSDTELDVYSTRPYDRLMQHFQQYIVPRLFRDAQPNESGTDSVANILERESQRYKPLHHSICAISALSLTYVDQSSKLEEAHKHYQHAVKVQPTTADDTDLFSDGVCFQHFLLYIYDICISPNTGEENMNLLRLQHIASERNKLGMFGHVYTHVLRKLFELDMYACLLGSSSGNFVKTIYQGNMLLHPDFHTLHAASLSTTRTGVRPVLPSQSDLLLEILRFQEEVMMQVAKIATSALSFRSQALANSVTTPGMFAHWQATTAQLQSELLASWDDWCPQDLAGNERQTTLGAASLPIEVRKILESTILLYHTATVYTRTSMYPGQGCIPTANHSRLLADTEDRVEKILTLAQTLSADFTDRDVVFPIFIAGVATSRVQHKNVALELIQRLEGSGIGMNTSRTLRLLATTIERQRCHVQAGGKMEEIDWMDLADIGRVMNCGL